MITGITSEVRRLVPGDAKEILEGKFFSLQRARKPFHIGSMATAMRAGEFPPATTIAFVNSPRGLELIDGQHRLNAQIAADVSLEYTVITYECDDVQTPGNLYTQFDIGAKRSMNDRMRALDLGGRSTLPNKQAQLLGNGAPYLKYRFGKFNSTLAGRMSPLERIETVIEFQNDAKRFFDCMAKTEKWLIESFMRPHFVALGSYLFRFAPEHAERLWIALATNDCGTETDPRRAIFNIAQNEKRAGGLNRTICVLQAVIRGWNLMIAGKECSRINIAPKPAERVRIASVNDAAFMSKTDSQSLFDQDERENSLLETDEFSTTSAAFDRLRTLYPTEDGAADIR